jgi:anti-sigma factor RsiW
MSSGDNGHVTDEQLLLHVDGELDHRTNECVRAHLDACWSCRARRDDLQAAIRTVVKLCNEVLLPMTPPPPAPWPGLRARLEEAGQNLRRLPLAERLRTRQVWPAVLRPPGVMVTALLLVLTVVVLWPRPTVLSAQELLARAETKPLGTAHRRVVLEEHLIRQDSLVDRREIESWYNADTGVKARRLYDRQRKLLEGEWVHADGSRRLYRPNAPPEHLTPGGALEPKLDELWRLDLSAVDFAAFVPQIELARVIDAGGAYVIEWQRARSTVETGLTVASLTLSKPDLHPIAQTFRLDDGHETREFRFTEIAFRPVAVEAIPAAALTPDPELTAAIVKVPSPKPPSPPTRRRISAEQLLGLEVETLNLLDEVGAFLGEQLTVERDPRRGHVRVEAIVDSPTRKQQLIEALGPLAGRPELRVDVATIPEVLERQKPAAAGATVVRSVEIENRPVPIGEALRQHVLGRLSGTRGDTTAEPDDIILEREMQRFALGVLERSLQARLHARALRQVVERFSPDELRTLSQEHRQTWNEIVGRHAAAFRRETMRLRTDLEPLFAPAPEQDPPSDSDVIIEPDLSHAAVRLFELGSTHDATVAMWFTLSNKEPQPEPPRWGPFAHSLRTGERLAAAIEKLVGSK